MIVADAPFSAAPFICSNICYRHAVQLFYGQQGWLALLRRQTSSHILPGFDSRPFDMDTIRMLANYTLILRERNASCASLL
jgi:hypothetical protein